MIRDEQRGQLSKHPPFASSLSWGSGTSDPRASASASASAPKRVMASVSGKG
jgi:hypothetical protein